jgi:hypothetical protein
LYAVEMCSVNISYCLIQLGMNYLKQEGDPF